MQRKTRMKNYAKSLAMVLLFGFSNFLSAQDFTEGSVERIEVLLKQNNFTGIINELKGVSDLKNISPDKQEYFSNLLVQVNMEGQDKVDGTVSASIMEEAVRLFPNHLRLRVKLGKELIGLAQLKPALDVMSSPVIMPAANDGTGDLITKDREAIVVMAAIQGNAVGRGGNIKQARELYKMAIRMDPNWVGGYFLLGALELGQRNKKEASKNLGMVLKLNPHHEGVAEIIKLLPEKSDTHIEVK